MFGQPATAGAACASDSGRTSGADRRRGLAATLAALAALLVAAASAASADAGTLAGTILSNTAQATYVASGVSSAASSNTSTIRVDELINFEIADGARRDGEAGFVVRNGGNGCETPVFSASADDGRSVAGIAIDADGDGQFDPARDTIYVEGSGPRLCPGDGVTVFLFLRPADGGQSARFTFQVHAAAGAGPRGTILPRAGDGGGDAVIGSDARRTVSLAGPDAMHVALVKSQAIIGRPNAEAARIGDMIAYALRTTATGIGSIDEAMLSDPLPAGLAYVPGSLALDGETLSDNADGDAGEVANNAIAVRLPPAAAPFQHLVTFNARVLAPQQLNGATP